MQNLDPVVGGSIGSENRTDILEIPRTDRLLDSMLVEEFHESHKTCLRDLLLHCFALDGLDFGMGGFLLCFRQRVDVVEDVGALVDGEGGAHLAEHVILRFTWESISGLGLCSSLMGCYTVGFDLSPCSGKWDGEQEI